MVLAPGMMRLAHAPGALRAAGKERPGRRTSTRLVRFELPARLRDGAGTAECVARHPPERAATGKVRRFGDVDERGDDSMDARAVLLALVVGVVASSPMSRDALASSRQYGAGWHIVAAPAGSSLPAWAIHLRESGPATWEGWQSPGTRLQEGYGYWVHLDSPTTFNFNEPGSRTYTASRPYNDPGWVMAGNPCARGAATLSGNFQAAWRWSGGSWVQAYSGDQVDVGEGLFAWLGTNGSSITLDAPACGNGGGGGGGGGGGNPPCPPPVAVGAEQATTWGGGGCNPPSQYQLSVTVDRGAGSTYHGGDPITVCYHMYPENIPYYVRLLRYSLSGINYAMFEGSDNGYGGGDCIHGYVGSPSNDTRTIRFEAYVGNSFVGAASTYYYVR